MSRERWEWLVGPFGYSVFLVIKKVRKVGRSESAKLLEQLKNDEAELLEGEVEERWQSDNAKRGYLGLKFSCRLWGPRLRQIDMKSEINGWSLATQYHGAS
jgi:hypothetical protein